jgi:hypothetical protein
VKPLFRFSYVLGVVLLLLVVTAIAGCSKPVPTTTAAPVNQVPTISSVTATTEMAPGATTNITCLAADPDNDALTYTWASKDGQIAGSGAEVQWTAPGKAGSYVIDVTVADGKGGQSAKSTTISVLAKPNQAPRITAFNITKPDKSQQTVVPGVAAEPVTVQALTTISINAAVEDPEGDDYNIMWSCTDGGKLEGKDNNVKFLAVTKNTKVTITATLIDSRGALVKIPLQIQIPCCGEGQFGHSGT